MKLKMRLLAPMFAVLMLGTATSAFADLQCQVTTIPVARAVTTGHWESTGDLLFTCTPVNGSTPAGTATTGASITVYYGGLLITNTPTLPVDHNIRVTGQTAGYAGVTLDGTRTDTGTTGVSQTQSLVAVFLPAQAAPVAGSFVLQNVLLSLNGAVTAGNGVNANINVISESGNTTLVGSPINIIANSAPMLNNTTQPPTVNVPPGAPAGTVAGPAQFTSTGASPAPTIACSTAACQNARASFSVSVSEDHIDSWRTNLQVYSNGVGAGGTGASNSTTGGTNVIFTFSGMLPGSIITNCVLVPPAGTAWFLTGSGIAGSNGTTTLLAELQPGSATNATNLAAIETLTLNCGTSVNNPAYLPGGSTGNATANITVDMRPSPSAGANVPPGQGTNALTGGTPRYQPGVGIVGPVTVISFGASATGQTTMIIPYALANVGSYDTGIAIANTTKDAVFGTDAQGAAPDTAGSITFNFYPADGSPSFTITPTTGFNLVGGVVPSGNSFIGNLSSILRTVNNTAAFQGYVIVQTNFTHAHATAYVYGGGASDRLTSYTDVLTITNPLTPGFGRGAFGGLVGVEATGK